MSHSRDFSATPRVAPAFQVSSPLTPLPSHFQLDGVEAAFDVSSSNDVGPRSPHEHNYRPSRIQPLSQSQPSIVDPFLENFASPPYNTAGHAGKTADSFHLSYDAFIGPSHFQLGSEATAPVLGQAITSAASSGQRPSNDLSSRFACRSDPVSSPFETALEQTPTNEQDLAAFPPDFWLSTVYRRPPQAGRPSSPQGDLHSLGNVSLASLDTHDDDAGTERLLICSCGRVCHSMNEYNQHRQRAHRHRSKPAAVQNQHSNTDSVPERSRGERPSKHAAVFYCEVPGCNRSEGGDWPFKRKDNLRSHMRTVNHSRQGRKKGFVLEQKLETKSIEERDSPMSALSDNLAASTTTWEDSSREHLSSVNTSDKAASTVASSTGGFENAEVDDSTMVDLTTFGNVDPYSVMDETAGSFSIPASSTMLEPLTSLEVHAAAISTTLQPSQAAIKRPVFDVVRNEFIAFPSPSVKPATTPEPNDKDQISPFLGQSLELDVSMLDVFDFQAFGNSSPNFGNDEMYGSFDNFAFMAEPNYHS